MPIPPLVKRITMDLIKPFRLALIAFTLLFAQIPCSAATYYVRKSGDDRNRGTNPARAFQTIAKAASVARNGDHIYIGAGTYDEYIYFDGLNAANNGRGAGRGNGRGNNGNGRGNNGNGRGNGNAQGNNGNGRGNNGQGNGRGNNGRGNGRGNNGRGNAGNNGNANAGWTMFYGDQLGRNTGDRGPVIIRSQQNRWAIHAVNTTDFLVTGITFQSHPSHADESYGCYVSSGTGTSRFLDCQFNDLKFGIRGHADNIVDVQDCGFQGGTYAIYSSKSKGVYAQNCVMQGVGYGVVTYDAPITSVTGSEFSDTHPETGEIRLTRDIHVSRTSLVAHDSRFSGSQIGIYGVDVNSASIERCNFNDTTRHGVYCKGQSMSMVDCQIVDGNYGITLGDLTGNESKLTNVAVEGMYVGVMAYEGDYDFDGVTLKSNKYGLYQRSGNVSVDLNGADEVSFTGNEYAILTNHTDAEDAKLSITGHDFSGNQRGILSYRTRVELRECTFAGEKWGAYLWDSRSINVRDCEFDGNSTDPSSHAYGLLARSAAIDIRDTSSRNANYGFYIDNTTDNEPVLKNLRSEDHAHSALYIRNGTWTYQGADNNVFRRSMRGVMASNMQWLISDVNANDNSCQYPIMDYYGDCVVTSANVQGTNTGFYAYKSNSLQVSNLNATGCGSYGLYLYDCVQPPVVDQCSATGNRDGLYALSTSNQRIQITASNFSDNTRYGALLRGTTLDPQVASDTTISGNQYGLSVHDQTLALNPVMNLRVVDNQYGVLSYRSELVLRGIGPA